MRYRLADRAQVRCGDKGTLLVTERPLRAVLVNAALAAVVEGSRPAGRKPASPAEAAIWERLAGAGLAERLPNSCDPGADRPSVTVVVPVRDRAAELDRCLASLAQVRYPADKLHVVVVDDGSRDGSPEVARARGASVASSGGVGLGPGAARNRGATAASGDILAFVDSDCRVSPDWLEDLVPAFSDPGVSAVGGRVDGMHAASALDRYEAAMSSLCLGASERSADRGSDTFYLPSCNLLVRRRDFLAAGGFREELRVGEDVDLTWRIRDRGGKISYLPRGAVLHEHRNRFFPFLVRRFQYGTSEGMLQTLHPRRRKRVVLPPALTAGLAFAVLAALARSRVAALLAVLLAAADTVKHTRLLRALGEPARWRAVFAARLRAAGSLGYYLAYHLVRYYLLPLGVAGLLFRPFAALWAAAVLTAASVDFRVRRPDLSVPVFFVLYLTEQAAYGAGAFWGCWRRGTFASYRPVFTKRTAAHAD